MKKTIVLIAIIALSIQVRAQGKAFAQKIVDTLTSAAFWGRGYTKDGMKKAGEYIAAQFSGYGLIPMGKKDYFQNFTYSVNTFPGMMSLTVNGKPLVPGKDFIIGPASAGVNARGEVEQVDSIQFLNRANNIVLRLQDKLTWSVDEAAESFTLVDIDKKSLSAPPKTFGINVENEVIKKFTAANICGMVKGTAIPDSFIFITAHYDHLGGMGSETFFPGANDNASGISLLMNLAHYYAQHPAKYSIGFICFAGEEAGLKGSKYFTEHPLVPLKNIRFLTNTDLAGTGEEGITVVNASAFPNEFAIMNKVNEENKLLTKINARGKAANSDHYFFTEKGVPAFFFYTLGGIKAYHDVFDVAATLPLTEHEDLFKLVVLFNEKLMGN